MSGRGEVSGGVVDANERADGGGDDDDGGVGRRASGDGHARLSEPSRVSPEEAGRGVANIKNCPLFLTPFLWREDGGCLGGNCKGVGS